MAEPAVFAFESRGDGTCALVDITLTGQVELLELPQVGPNGETVTAVRGDIDFRKGTWSGRRQAGRVHAVRIPASYRCVETTAFSGLGGMTAWVVDPENGTYAAVDGLLYTKDLGTLVSCPVGRRGTIRIPEGTAAVGDCAFLDCRRVEEVALPRSIREIGRYAFSSGPAAVRIPDVYVDIDDEAFGSGRSAPAILAAWGSCGHRFATDHRIRFTLWEVSWDSEDWKRRFAAASAAHDGWERQFLRCQVWRDTQRVVADAAYALPDGRTVALDLADGTAGRFYSRAFRAVYEPVPEPVEIRVVPEDCLDVAREWAGQGLAVCVLNMANAQNPGGGVTVGDGAQEEYLFRCSDYFRSLFRYAPYAVQYGLDRAGQSYPLDPDHGGIYSPAVTVFRGNEAGGYAYLEAPFRAGMIAVAGIDRPALVYDRRGEARIAPQQVETARNKIRTILRIAQDNGQRCLVLGALGCGAFRNPPRHVAELFREVLCEDEFDHAFRRITFAIKSDRNSNGSANFDAFYSVLDGFVPEAGR